MVTVVYFARTSNKKGKGAMVCCSEGCRNVKATTAAAAMRQGKKGVVVLRVGAQSRLVVSRGGQSLGRKKREGRIYLLFFRDNGRKVDDREESAVQGKEGGKGRGNRCCLLSDW